MAQYVGKILRLVREMTDNVGWSQSSSTGNPLEGITDDLLIEFLNEAQELLQSRIVAVYPGEFVEEFETNIVANQEEYTITDNVYLNNKLVSVEYSQSGDDRDYYPLPQMSLHQRSTYEGLPRWYIRRSGALLINPIPSSAQGSLRFNYYRTTDRIDKRRGLISSINSTSIVVANDSDYDLYALTNADYVSLVSRQGVVKDYAIAVSSFNSGTRTITVPSATHVAAANDYVVLGQYANSHCVFPDEAIRYLRTYCQLRAFHKDSSSDAVSEMQICKDMLTDIVDAWSELTEDIMDVPVLDDTLE